MTATAYDRLHEALVQAGRNVKDNAHGKCVAQCPAHNDVRPSLSVTGIEGSVLLYCHAGCQTDDVLAALNLTKSDLFDNRRDTTYAYPGGRKVHRKADKQFPQSGNKADRSLFRADRIADADHVLVVEGEKDVLAAEAVGAVAVCSAMGAGKAHLADWSPLAGKTVTVVADDDPPGHKHAAKVAELVTAVGATSVRIVKAAAGKDLADHIAAGKTIDELRIDDDAREAPRGMSMIRLADVQPERVSWLWPGYIPRGKLVTLDGDPGLGKSTLALALAAAVTNAAQWPDGTRCEDPGGVLLLSAEDGLADTVRPRLDAAGADVTKVHAIEGVPSFTEDGERVLRPPTLADIDALASAIAETGAALLIVDVLMAYLPSGSDSHKDQDIRQVLGRLSRLADTTGCTVLLIRHLNKAKGGDPIYRGGGSIGIVGAARAGLLVAADPADTERRILASIKSNLGPAPVSMAYKLTDAGTGVARVEWDGATTHSAGELLRGPDDSSDNDARTEAEHWLEDYLTAQGEVRSDEVKRDAAKAMIAERTLKRAMKSLGVEVACRGMPRRTYWRLTNGANSEETTPGTQNLGPNGPTERDQHKHDGPTGPKSQWGQPVSDGPTGPPGGITAATPGMTDRVQRILASTAKAPTMAADPPCRYCGNPVVGKQTEPATGQPAHYTCATKSQEKTA